MFTHILLFLRLLIRIYFLSVLAKRETSQLILEHPAEFPVHGHPGSGLTSLRTVLDRIFFFSKEVFLFFQATVPALHLGVSCDSMCLEGSTPGAPAARFSHKSTFNAVLANTEKKSILQPQVFGMNKGKTIKSMSNTSREGENKTSISAGKEELTGDRKYGKTV